MNDRTFRFKLIDPVLLSATATLAIIGIVFIFSSGVNTVGISLSNEWIKQIIWAVTGFVLLVIFAVVNHQRFKSISLYIFVFTMLLLVITALFGTKVRGHRSWIGLGELGIQPSEFAKISTILFLSAYLSEIGNGIKELPRFVIALLIVSAPIALILVQPDLGTAIVFFPIFLIIVLVAGARLHHLLFVLFSALFSFIFCTLPELQTILLGQQLAITRIVADFQVARFTLILLSVIYGLSAVGFFVFQRQYFFWLMYPALLLSISIAGGLILQLVLQEYQIMRLVVFLNPWVDPRGAGWNIIQSVTAVGAGGFSGVGFLEGTQSHLRFLPQQSTDFIFSIIAEEWGFLGGLAIIGLFALIIGRGLTIIYAAKDSFATLVATGIVAMIFFHTAVNIGMAIGIMPITGIPLMLVSYGGSSLWTAMIGIGFLINVGLARLRS